jgi:hypothetical protein
MHIVSESRTSFEIKTTVCMSCIAKRLSNSYEYVPQLPTGNSASVIKAPSRRTKLQVQTISKRISVIIEPIFNEEQRKRNIYNSTAPEETAEQ